MLLQALPRPEIRSLKSAKSQKKVTHEGDLETMDRGRTWRLRLQPVSVRLSNDVAGAADGDL